MTRIRIHHALVCSASILLEVGCVHYPDNARMNHYDPQSGYRFRNLSNTGNSDSLQIFLAFSGGGAPVPPHWIMACWKKSGSASALVPRRRQAALYPPG